MSLENIIKYATKTPTNTNPAVMASVISQNFKESKEEIVDEVLSMAKAYSDSKGGYVEPGKVYAFDGNLEGKEVFVINEAISLVKLSNDPLNLGNVRSFEKITINNQEWDTNINIEKYEKNKFIVSSVDDDGTFCIMIGENQYIISVENMFGDIIARGTWILHGKIGKTVSYISEIQMSDTVRPIDQKYLPGMCLPVVELTTVPTTEGAELTTNEIARMNEVAELGTPIVVVYDPGNGAAMKMVFSYISIENMTVFAAYNIVEDCKVQIAGDSGMWMFQTVTG